MRGSTVGSVHPHRINHYKSPSHLPDSHSSFSCLVTVTLLRLDLPSRFANPSLAALPRSWLPVTSISGPTSTLQLPSLLSAAHPSHASLVLRSFARSLRPIHLSHTESSWTRNLCSTHPSSAQHNNGSDLQAFAFCISILVSSYSTAAST